MVSILVAKSQHLNGKFCFDYFILKINKYYKITWVLSYLFIGFVHKLLFLYIYIQTILIAGQL